MNNFLLQLTSGLNNLKGSSGMLVTSRVSNLRKFFDIVVADVVRKFNKESSIDKIMEKEDKKELKEITKKLEKYKAKSNLPIEDKNLKKRIAKVCSKLIEETPNDKTSIMETSYIITGNFVWSTYGNKLDEAMNIAGELELPEEHVSSGNVLDMWNKMKKIFQQHLSE